MRKTNIILEPLGCLYLFIFNLLSGLLPNIAPALTAAGSESFGQKLSEAGGDSTGTHPKRERMNENEHVLFSKKLCQQQTAIKVEKLLRVSPSDIKLVRGSVPLF